MRHIILAFGLLIGLYFLPESEASDAILVLETNTLYLYSIPVYNTNLKANAVLVCDKDYTNCRVENKEVIDCSEATFSPSPCTGN